MKFLFSIILLPTFLIATKVSSAQTVNWTSLKNQDRHIANINIGAEHGFVFGAGYGYRLRSKWPIILNAEASIPAGDNLLDDYKIKTGGQIKLLRSRSFNVAAKVQGVFRRYQSDYATLLDFGSDMSATAGFYKRKWFVAGEFGFDKAIVTHFKHTDLFKSNYPGVQDGWYEPATGGNFYYGIQTGYTMKRLDIYLKAGRIVEQDFKTSPTLPYYAQLGVNARF